MSAARLKTLSATPFAYFKHDDLGETEWIRVTLINEVVNAGLRVAFNQTSVGTRPDGSAYGFPSGHAGFVFSQAAFLQQRYGVPALAVASAISYIRVREDKHHWRDVIARAGITYGTALLTVTPLGAANLAPVVGPGYLGIRFQRSF